MINQDGLFAMTWATRQVKMLVLEQLVLLVIVRAIVQDTKQGTEVVEVVAIMAAQLEKLLAVAKVTRSKVATVVLVQGHTDRQLVLFRSCTFVHVPILFFHL